MGIATSSIRRGAARPWGEPVHRVATRGAGPGSVWSTPEDALGKVRAPSSQAFRHDALVLSASPWWPVLAPTGTSNLAGAWLFIAAVAIIALDCSSGVPSKQAFATPEAKANSHTSSTTKMVLRWVPV